MIFIEFAQKQLVQMGSQRLVDNTKCQSKVFEHPVL